MCTRQRQSEQTLSGQDRSNGKHTEKKEEKTTISHIQHVTATTALLIKRVERLEHQYKQCYYSTDDHNCGFMVPKSTFKGSILYQLSVREQ